MKEMTKQKAMEIAAQAPTAIVGGWAVVEIGSTTVAWCVTGELCVIELPNPMQTFPLTGAELETIWQA